MFQWIVFVVLADSNHAESKYHNYVSCTTQWFYGRSSYQHSACRVHTYKKRSLSSSGSSQRLLMAESPPNVFKRTHMHTVFSPAYLRDIGPYPLVQILLWCGIEVALMALMQTLTPPRIYIPNMLSFQTEEYTDTHTPYIRCTSQVVLLGQPFTRAGRVWCT